jgi:hypothetical protein
VLIHFDSSGSVDALEGYLTALEDDPKIQGIIVFACTDNGFTPASLDPLLASVNKPLIGGVFPNLIYRAQKVSRGTIVWGVARPMDVGLVPALSDATTDIDSVLDRVLGEPGDESTLQFVLVDGFSSRIGAFLNALHDLTGTAVDTIGGGAGSLDMVQRPCIMTNDGLIMDAAVVSRLGGTAGVGVAHGWSPIDGSFHITGAENTVLHTLDWRPAFEVYREVVEKHSGRRFSDDNFFDIAKAYPFGLARLDAERIVRDPLMRGEHGALVCVGEVNEGEHVDILHGDRGALIAAAQVAREQADATIREKPGLRLFMDCISRVLFLEEDFEQELARVAIDDLPVIGACTFGEIANGAGEFLEFFNKTSVVATLSEARQQIEL